MTNKQPIAKYPTDINGEHEFCSICKDDNVSLVIQGGSTERGTNCHFCDNTIVLCAKHTSQLLEELSSLKVG